MRYGVSMYGGVMAYNDFNRISDTTLRKYGYSIFRVWTTWDMDKNGNPVSGYRVINTNGSIDATNLTRLKNLIARIVNWGGSVDVTIGARAGLVGMPNFTSHKAGVTNLVTALRGVKGIYCIDVANEFIAAGYTDSQVAQLLQAARAADGSRGGFTASADGAPSTVVARYIGIIKSLGSNWQSYLGMVSPHTAPRDKSQARNTQSNVTAIKNGLAAYNLQVYMQEEGRWNNPYTTEQEYYDSAAGARKAGAAAYILHNSAGYDLRTKSWESQLTATEAKVLPFVPLK